MNAFLPTSPPSPPPFRPVRTLAETSATLADIIAFYESEKRWAMHAHSSLSSRGYLSERAPSSSGEDSDTSPPPGRSTKHNSSPDNSDDSTEDVKPALKDGHVHESKSSSSSSSQSPHSSGPFGVPMSYELLRKFEGLMVERIDSCRRVAQLVKEAEAIS